MRPEWLWCLLPAALLLLLLWRQRRGGGSWQSVIAPQLLQHLVSASASGRTRNLLPGVACAWIIASLAASGPSWEKIPQPVHQAQDALVLLLDLSYSMKSADLPPSRTDRARQKLLDLLALRREGQTGLIAYSGDAHIVTPLTDDTPTIANLLPALHPDMMPVPGSDPLAAVQQGLELLRSAGVRGGLLLLVTDGISEDDRREIEMAMRGSGARLSVMGVGTATGAPIPLPQGGFVKDGDGAIVMPGLDEEPLFRLAAATGGQYRAMRIDNSDLEALLAASALPVPEQTLALQRSADSWDDKGYLLVPFLLPFALALFRRGWLLGLLPLLLLGSPQPATAQSWDDLWLTPDQRGQRALRSGDNARAAELFEDSQWAGTAAYRDGDYASAAQHFGAADSADAWFNRGNALARAGQLDEAIAAYQESLQREPDREDASANLELLQRLREQQQQQQQQQQQNGQEQEQPQEGQQGQQQEQRAGQEAQPGQQQDSQPQESPEQAQSQSSPGEQQDGAAEQPAQADRRDSEQQDREAAQDAQQAGAGEQEKAAAEQQAAARQAQEQAAEREMDQAMEQWLRRVPDDPSGLLREKFRYESRQRQEEGPRRNEDVYW
ncbi:MAG: hypothetical protein CME59_11350 [Halioglobus sp.]|nr:hypothetical protein [Halioglobus sp.]